MVTCPWASSVSRRACPPKTPALYEVVTTPSKVLGNQSTLIPTRASWQHHYRKNKISIFRSPQHSDGSVAPNDQGLPTPLKVARGCHPVGITTPGWTIGQRKQATHRPAIVQRSRPRPASGASNSRRSSAADWVLTGFHTQQTENGNQQPADCRSSHSARPNALVNRSTDRSHCQRV